MIQLILNDFMADMNVQTAMTFEYNNPLFAEDVQFGDYSYPIELPPTPRNKAFFEHLERLDSTKSITDLRYQVKLFIDGVPYLEAVGMLMAPITANGYKISVLVNTFADAITGKNLRDYSYGGRIRFYDYPSGGGIGADNLQTFFDYIKDVGSGAKYANYRFPVIWNKQMKNTPTASAYVPFVNMTLLDGSVGPTEYNYFTPCLKVVDVFRKLLQEEGWDMIDYPEELGKVIFTPNIVREVKTQAANLMNPAILAMLPFDPLWKWADFLPDCSVADLITALRQMFNLGVYFNASTKRVTMVAKSDSIYADNEPLDWTDKFILGSFEVTPNEKPKGYTLAYDFPSEDKVKNNYLQTWYNILIKNYRLYQSARFASPTNYQILRDLGSRDVEAIDEQLTSFGEWDMLYAAKSGIYYFVSTQDNSGTLNVNGQSYYSDPTNYWYTEFFDQSTGGAPPASYTKWQALKVNLIGDLADFGDLPYSSGYTGAFDNEGPAYGDCYYIQSEGCYVVFHPCTDGSVQNQIWHFLASHDLRSITIGTGEKKITIPGAPLIMAEPTNPFALNTTLPDIWRVPVCDIEPVNVVNRDKAKVPLRLMVYHGAHNYRLSSNEYYLATNDNIAHHTTLQPTLDEPVLRLDGEDGIYETRYKAWLAFKDTAKRVSGSVKLNLTDLLNINLNRQIRYDNNVYLIEKININIKGNGSITAKVNMYQL